MTEHTQNIAWAAGFLDGEGSFMLAASESDRTARCIVAVDQIYMEPLAKLAQTLGGQAYPLKRQTSSGNDVYRWHMRSAAELRVVLPLLIPHLTVKKARANLLLSYANLTYGRGVRATPEIIHARKVVQDDWQALQSGGQ